MEMTQDTFLNLIRKVASKETSANPENWTAENPLWGHCAVVSLLAQDYFGGELVRGSLEDFPEYAYLSSHYGYGSAPFGVTLGNLFGIDGNIYDKFVHFSFGFLIVYPIREFFLRASTASGFWGYLFPFIAIMGLASIYEIFEWVTVLNLPANIGYLFIGGNDPFDASKDMFVAGIGSLIALVIIAILERIHLKKSFWLKMKQSFLLDKRTFPKEDKIIHGEKYK